MSQEYEPLRIHVDKFIGKKEALGELMEKLLKALDECKTNRFKAKFSIIELEPLKPKQVKLDA